MLTMLKQDQRKVSIIHDTLCSLSMTIPVSFMSLFYCALRIRRGKKNTKATQTHTRARTRARTHAQRVLILALQSPHYMNTTAKDPSHLK